jgi:hypothetical protein
MLRELARLVNAEVKAGRELVRAAGHPATITTAEKPGTF